MGHKHSKIRPHRTKISRCGPFTHSEIYQSVQKHADALHTEPVGAVPSDFESSPGSSSDLVTAPPPYSEHQPMCQTRSFTYSIRYYPTLVVIFRLDSHGEVDAFCIHAESEQSQHLLEHTFFDLHRSTGPPRRLYCYGRQSRICYVAAREIYRLLMAGTRSPGRLNTQLSRTLPTTATRCIICRSNLGAAVHRPTLCASLSCLREYLTADLNIRLEDILFHDCAVDLLLASIQAVAMKNNVDLLPGWPVSRLGNPGEVRTIMDSLPSLAYPIPYLTMSQMLSNHYSSLAKGKQTELLLSWVCTRFRGMITTASNGYSIPGLDEVVQYIVKDGQPENEARFAKHNHLRPRHVLFHGTSIDRLYAVLVQGLQILSCTPLSQHGAVYGKGIYMAREPSLARSYAKSNIPNTNTPIAGLRGDISKAKVILACEHAGDDTSTPSHAPHGVHVIQDPSRIMVRYIFLVPPGTRMPKASELNGPILKMAQYLRDTL